MRLGKFRAGKRAGLGVLVGAAACVAAAVLSPSVRDPVVFLAAFLLAGGLALLAGPVADFFFRRPSHVPARRSANAFLAYLSKWLLGTNGPLELRARASAGLERARRAGGVDAHARDAIAASVWYPLAVVEDWADATVGGGQLSTDPEKPSGHELLERLLEAWPDGVRGEGSTLPRLSMPDRKGWRELGDVPPEMTDAAVEVLDRLLRFTPSERDAVSAHRVRYQQGYINQDELIDRTTRIRPTVDDETLGRVQHMLGVAFCDDEPLALDVEALRARVGLPGHYFMLAETSRLLAYGERAGEYEEHRLWIDGMLYAIYPPGKDFALVTYITRNLDLPPSAARYRDLAPKQAQLLHRLREEMAEDGRRLPPLALFELYDKQQRGLTQIYQKFASALERELVVLDAPYLVPAWPEHLGLEGPGGGSGHPARVACVAKQTATVNPERIIERLYGAYVRVASQTLPSTEARAYRAYIERLQDLNAANLAGAETIARDALAVRPGLAGS